MKRGSPFILLVALAWSSAPAQVQWTLNQCLATARARSPHLKAASNLIRTSSLSISELGRTALPQVNIEGTSLFTPAGGRIVYDPIVTNGGELGAQVVVEQSLYDGGVRSVRSNQLAVESAERATEYRIADRDLTYEVRIAFIESLRAHAEEELRKESVAQIQEYLDLVRSMSKGGGAGYTDVLRTETELAAAQTLLQKAAEGERVAAYTLTGMLGVAPDTTVAAKGTLDSLILVPGIDSAAAPETRPGALDLDVANMEVERSAYDIALARSERHPVVSLVGDAGLLTSGENLRLPPDQRSPYVGYSFGVSVDVPILNWGATDLRVQERELASENLRLETEALSRSIDAEWEKALLRLRAARERLLAAERTTALAGENYLLTKSKYAGGGSIALEVLSAQQLLTDSKLDEVEARTDVLKLTARVDQLRTQ